MKSRADSASGASVLVATLASIACLRASFQLRRRAVPISPASGLISWWMFAADCKRLEPIVPNQIDCESPLFSGDVQQGLVGAKTDWTSPKLGGTSLYPARVSIVFREGPNLPTGLPRTPSFSSPCTRRASQASNTRRSTVGPNCTRLAGARRANSFGGRAATSICHEPPPSRDLLMRRQRPVRPTSLPLSVRLLSFSRDRSLVAAASARLVLMRSLAASRGQSRFAIRPESPIASDRWAGLLKKTRRRTSKLQPVAIGLSCVFNGAHCRSAQVRARWGEIQTN